MKIGKRIQYHDVLSIPEGKIKDYKISHVHMGAGSRFDLSNFRTALFAGHGNGHRTGITLDFPTKWHCLSYKGGTWMTDFPIEQYQISRAVEKIRFGDVLVGGLGIGYVLTVLARRRKIKSIIVVEKSAAVIDLVWPHLLKTARKARAKVTIVHDDLFKYLKNYDGEFDWAFYDIWQGDGETTLLDTVIPLLKLSDGKVWNRPICWNEDVMRGQSVQALQHRYLAATVFAPNTNYTIDMLCGDSKSKWVTWSMPYFRWIRDTSPSEKERNRASIFYGRNYGQPGFEQAWRRWIGK